MLGDTVSARHIRRSERMCRISSIERHRLVEKLIDLFSTWLNVRHPSEDHGRRGSIDTVDVCFEIKLLGIGCDFHMREFSFLLVSGVIGRCVLDQIHEVTQTKTQEEHFVTLWHAIGVHLVDDALVDVLALDNERGTELDGERA